MFGFLLAIYTRDTTIVNYFYSELADQFQTDESDLILLLKICITLEWSEGFMYFINAPMTDKIFIHSSKGFKLDYVQYILSNEAVESNCINPNKTEAFVKEIKERMTVFPYCSVSWLFIEPDSKNTRFTKSLAKNFNLASINLLSQSN